MIQFKSVMKCIRYHGEILLKGFIKMLFGTATAVLMALAIYGFFMIPYDNGYAAVGDFVFSASATVLAVGCVYVMGGKCKKGAKK